MRYVKPGRLPEAMGGVLPYGFTLRQKADSDALSVFEAQAVADLIADVDAFIKAVELLLCS